MKAGKKLIIALLSAIMIVSIFMFVGCEMPGGGGDSNDGDNPIDTPIEVGEEVGIWYSDTPSGEFVLTLVQGGGFTISAADGLQFGVYTKSGDDISLVANTGSQNNTYWAKRDGDQMTLNMGGNSYRLYRKVDYTVTYNVNGGTEIAEAAVQNGKTAVKPADPKKDGHQFIGWYKDSDLTQEYDFATIVTGDITVYARYEAYVPGLNDYTVTLIADGEIVEEVKTVGGKLYNLPEAEKADAEFLGWWMSDFNNGEKLTAQYVDQTIDENCNLYAVWKNDAPAASVNAAGLTWTAVGANKKYSIEITGPDEQLEAATTAETSYAFDFASKQAGQWTVSVVCDGKSNTYYYNNKGLARVSLFNVVGNVLVYAPVENAQKYYVTVECGNQNHNHTKVDNGTSTNYNFANCQMAEGGIKFTVEAVAAGYVSSVSDVFAYERKLAQVEGLTVNANGEAAWNPVENAAYYLVTVVNGGETYVENVGNITKYSLKNFSGDMSVSVQALADGYVTSTASEINFNKTALAAPHGILVKENKISWTAVEGAKGYNVMIGDTVYTAETNSFTFLTEYAANGAGNYKLSIQAVAEKAENNSEYSDLTTVYYLIMGADMSYDKGIVSWQPVIGAYRYGVKVNNGTALSVESGASSASVILTATNNNITVIAYDGDEQVIGEASLKVEAKAIYFDTLGGKALDPMYKVAGDPMNDLPDAEYNGYEFAGWYNLPGGPSANATEYTDEFYKASTNTVLFAYYTPMPYNITLSVAAGETVPYDTVVVYYQQDYVLPTATTEDASKVFGGWYSEINGQGIQYADAYGNSLFAFIDTADRTLYPGWLDVLAYREADGGASYSVYSGPGIEYVSEITVPEKHKGLPVLKVDSFAIKGMTSNSKTKIVNIPDTITVVEGTAFETCTALLEVNVYATENANKGNYTSLEGVLYQRGSVESTSATIAYYPKAKAGVYVIPEEVSFGNVNLPITYIKQNTFKSYLRITGLYIPWTVESIEDSAFYAATGILSIEFGKAPEGKEEKALTIGKQSFYDIYKMTEITLPARLANFDPASFEKCTGLTSINIEQGGTKYKSIDGVLATADGTEIVFCPKGREGEYTVPAGVMTIGAQAFKGCTKLTDIVIPGWVTEIEDEAFSGCTGVLTLTFKGTADDLPLNVGESAFYQLNKIETLTLPANMGTVAAHAFGNTSKLVTVIVEAGKDFKPATNAFGTTATSPLFYVKYLTLGANVPVVDITGVFGQKIETISIDENHKYYSSDSYGALYDKDQTQIVYFPSAYTGAYKLPDTIVDIGARTFMNKNITSITIGYQVKTIGEHAFNSATSLLTVEFEKTPDDKEPVDLTVGEFAFAYCSKIQSIILPERTVSVGNKTFANCSALTEVSLPATLTTIGYDTGTASYPTEPTVLLFTNCDKLQAVTVSDGNKYFTAIDGILYGLTDGVATDILTCPRGKGGVVNIPGTVKTVWPQAFYYNGNITEINFGAHDGSFEVEFGAQVFYWMRGLERITLPAGLTTLSKNTFYYSDKLTEIVIPYTVSMIENDPFYYCSNLNSIIFAPTPEGAEEVDLLLLDGSMTSDEYGTYYYGAFANLNKLESIVFPSRLKSDSTQNATGAYALASCDKLTSVTLSTGMTVIGNAMFREDRLLEEVIVPQGAKIDAIGEYAFNYAGYNVAEGLDFTIPATVTVLGKDAFYNSGLTEAVVPAAVKEILEYTFAYTNKLTSLTFEDTVEKPSQLESIGKYILSQNKLVTTVTIPASVKEIEDYAFYSAYALKTVNFTPRDGGTALTSIGDYAFQSTAIESFVFPEAEGKIELGVKLFTTGTNKTLTSVHLSSSITSIDNAFAGCRALSTITVAGDNENFAVAVNAPMLLNKQGTAIQYIFGTIKGDFTVPDGYEEIAPRAFQNQPEITGIKIAASVKQIGEYAFSNCTALKTVTFEDTADKPSVLNTLGNYAFEKCTALKSVTIPRSLAALGTNTFDGCTSLEDVTLPSTMTNIGNYSFQNCTSLKSIALPENLTTMGTNMFKNCTSLTSVTIGSKLKSIGNYAFYGCTALKGIDIPSNITSLGTYTFQNCASLESIVVPSGITSIGTNTFNGCVNLKSVTFDGKVTSLGTNVFKGCTSLKNITLPAGITALPNSAFQDSGIQSIDLSNVTTIGTYAFANCVDLNKVTLGSSLTSIGTYAFIGCADLTAIDLPASLTTLGDFSFMGTGLKSVVIPAKITKIGSKETSSYASNTSATSYYRNITDEEKLITGASVFSYCKDLSSVTFLGDVTSIGSCAFMECTSLKSITIPSTVTSIGDYAFAWTGITSITIPAATKTLGNKTTYSAVSTSYPRGLGGSVFEGCTDLQAVVFGGAEDGTSKLATINATVFMGCDSLKSVTLPNNEIVLATSAFRGWTGLERITLPDKIKLNSSATSSSGNAYLFKDCINVEEIIFPAKLTKAYSMGTYTFENCEKLTSVSLPSNLTSIGGQTFQGCTSLENVTLPADTTTIGTSAFARSGIVSLNIPAKVKTINSKIFDGCEALDSITIDSNNPYYFMRDGAIVSASGSITVVPNYVSGIIDLNAYPGVSITKDAFFGCENITRIILPSNWTTVSNGAFEGAIGLLNIDIPEGVTKIDSYAFAGCTKLRNVTLPSTLTTIGSYAFQNCTSLASLELPDALESIATYTFDGAGLETLTFPERITAIPNYSIRNTANLNTVEFKGELATIGTNAFQNSGVKSIVIPETVQSIGYTAFNGSGLEELTILSTDVVFGTASPSSLTYGIFANSAALETVSLPEGIKSLAPYMFGNCTSLKTINLPDSLTTLPTYLFYGCSSLETVDLPDTLTALSSGMFQLSGIQTLEIPEKVTLIPTSFFRESTIQSFTVPEGITKIDSYAFQDCLQLTELNLPESLTDFGSTVFSGATALKSIVIPASVTTTSLNLFAGWTEEQTIYIRGSEFDVTAWNASWNKDCAANVVYNYKG